MDIIYFLYFDEIPNSGYIGKTSNGRISRRIYEHKNEVSNGKKKTKLYNWLRKYIVKYGYKLKYKIILRTNNSDLDEQLVISKYKNLGVNLKNTAIGGEGIKKGYKHNDDFKLKKKLDAINRGTWANTDNPFYDKYGTKNHKSKPVYKYSLEGEFIEKYDSQRLAGKAIGKYSYHKLISRAVKTGEIAYGFLWSDKLKTITPKEATMKFMTDDDILYCLTEFKKGRSINSIHKEIGFSRGQITRKIKIH